MSAKTLTPLQEETVAAMLAPRSSERRAARLRYACLRRYTAAVRARGHKPARIYDQVQDILDVYVQRRSSVPRDHTRSR